MKHISLAILALISVACSSDVEYVDQLRGKIINLDSVNTTQDSLNDLNLIISFDGSCSSCNVTFIEFVEKWNDKKLTEISIFVIVLDQDLFQVEFLLEDFGVELSNNIYMMNDSEDIFLRHNTFINEYWSILLVDNNMTILSSENPFGSKGTKKLYKQYNLL